MDIFLTALISSAAAVNAGVTWYRTTKPEAVTFPSTDSSAPEWGTAERVEWHRSLRQYHTQKTIEAARAIRADAPTEE